LGCFGELVVLLEDLVASLSEALALLLNVFSLFKRLLPL
jgi:hypothetical protein